MKDRADTAAVDTEGQQTERLFSIKSRDAFALAGLAILIVVGGVLALGYDEVWITGPGMADWIDGIGNWGQSRL